MKDQFQHNFFSRIFGFSKFVAGADSQRLIIMIQTVNDKIIRRPLGHKNIHIKVGHQKMKKKKEERKDITYHIAFDNKSVYCIAWELKMPPSTQRDKLLAEGEFFWLSNYVFTRNLMRLLFLESIKIQESKAQK